MACVPGKDKLNREDLLSAGISYTAASLNKMWELGRGSVPRKKIERIIGKIREMGTEAGSGACIPGSP